MSAEIEMPDDWDDHAGWEGATEVQDVLGERRIDWLRLVENSLCCTGSVLLAGWMVHCSWHFRAEPIWLAKSVAGTVMYGFLALASGYLTSGLIRGEGYPTVRFKASFDLLHSAFALASIVDLWPPQSFFSTTMLVIFVPYFVISAICSTRDVTRKIWPD